MPDISVQDLIRQEAEKAGVPPALALAVAEQESGFNPTVIGPKLPSGEQAIGTFQILPSTAKTRGFDPNDPVQNIRGGVGYLRELLDQHNGDLNQVLRTYGGVKTDEAYVPGVVGRLKKFQTAPADTQQTAQTTKEAPTPPAVTPPAGASPSLTERFLSAIRNPTAVPVPGVAVPVSVQSGIEALKGFGQTAVNRSTALMDMVRQRLLGIPGERPQPFAEPTTGAGKIGAAAEPMAEFAAATPIAGGAAVGGPLLEAGAQAATAHALAKSQGASDTGANIAAGLSAFGPLANQALESWAPKLVERTQKQLANVFTSGLAEKGPMIDYAVKTGDAATPEVAKAVQIVRKAAADTLDVPIQSSWGKWQTLLAKDVAKKGQTLQEALQGPLGSVEVPKAGILKALDDLEATTQHFAEIAAPPGATTAGDFMNVTFNKPLAQEVRTLRDFLNQYGNTITVRNLTDIKRTWDDYVYTLSTAGKVGLTPEALVTTAMKKAMFEGANSIRAALDTEAPTIASLNEAVTDAIRLQDLVGKLYKVNPAMSPAKKLLIDSSMMIAGGTAGQTLGGHWLLGSILGRTGAHVLEAAIESPLWQTASPALKNRVAQALARGDAKAAMDALRPIIQSTVSSATSNPQGSPAAAGAAPR